MNMKFFDPDEDSSQFDHIKQDLKKYKATIAKQLLSQGINEEMKRMEEEVRAECMDKGKGFCLPPLPEGEHINSEKKNLFAQKNTEPPQLQMIVCYRGIYKCEHNEKLGKNAPQQVAYIDGIDDSSPSVTLRI